MKILLILAGIYDFRFILITAQIRIARGANSSSDELGGEERLVVHKGPILWEKRSEVVPRAGENVALEEFLAQMYRDLFNPQNRKWVKDNLTVEERYSLKKNCRWNKEYDNPRVMRMEDKGSSFVIDWRSKYLRE